MSDIADAPTRGISTDNPNKTPDTSGIADRVATLHKRGQGLTFGLGEAVALLMRDSRFRHLTLAELEWMLLPALAANQALFMRGAVRAQAKEGAADAGEKAELMVPVGFALWAKVSDAVHEKLTQQNKDGAPYRLAPGEWASGDRNWLLLMVGPEKVLPELKKKLAETAFGGSSFQEHVLCQRTSGTSKNGGALDG